MDSHGTKMTVIRVNDLVADDLKAAYEWKTGVPLSHFEASWEADYEDGVGFSYLTGEGKVFIDAFSSPDDVPDDMVGELLADDVVLDDREVMAIVSLDTLVDTLSEYVLHKLGLLALPRPYRAGIGWDEMPIGDFVGTFEVVLDEEKVEMLA